MTNGCKQQSCGSFLEAFDKLDIIYEGGGSNCGSVFKQRLDIGFKEEREGLKVLSSLKKEYSSVDSLHLIADTEGPGQGLCNHNIKIRVMVYNLHCLSSQSQFLVRISFAQVQQ